MISRRRTIRAGALATTVAIGGCLSRGGSDSEPHPATDASFPTLGDDPDDVAATVVAFEDPSCDSCATFAERTFPKLREAAREGRLAYRWCGLPWVEPWSDSAVQALFEVHDRSTEAFWTLKGRYYDAQTRLDSETVLEWTSEQLRELDVETEPVIEAIERRRRDGDVERHERIAEESDVEQVPSFALFSEGEYVTTVVGAQSYEVFEGALEL